MRLSNCVVDANAADYISISQLSANKDECLIYSRQLCPALWNQPFRCMTGIGNPGTCLLSKDGQTRSIATGF
jgi:hypothetical protein